MKESWIEKLIELLNQHRIEKTNIQYKLELPIPMRDLRFVLSKEYWFIQRLVENDKIDRDKKEIEKSDYDITFTWALTMDKKSDLDIMVDTLLMLLSISDEPISDLISYLR